MGDTLAVAVMEVDQEAAKRAVVAKEVVATEMG